MSPNYIFSPLLTFVRLYIRARKIVGELEVTINMIPSLEQLVYEVIMSMLKEFRDRERNL